MELTKKDIVVSEDWMVSDDDTEIECYLETWFDVDKKFGTNTKETNAWINLYAYYNPDLQTLKMEYEIDDISNDNPFKTKVFKYTPTENEKKLITDMIEERVMKSTNKTASEVLKAYQNGEVIG